jgi:hypothetical protein
MFPKDLDPLNRRMIDNIDEMYLEQPVQLFQIMQAARKSPRTLSLWDAS